MAKPSRPSRAYIHLTSQAHLQPLSDKVRLSSFVDAEKTTKDYALIGPPSLEFAPYTRIPGGKRRNDARQSTIDQDSEFQAFLESLTNPAPKASAAETDGKAVDGIEKKEIATTPLIEHLREKKAAKEKAAKEKSAAGAKGAGKHGRQESKDEKASDKVGEKNDGKKSSAKAAREAAASPDKSKKPSKAERAAKEAVKVLNKEAASSPAPATATSEASAPTQKPTPERKRERGNASIAAKMLQRDLGIGPGAGGRRAKRDPAISEVAKQTDTATATKDAAPATAPTAPAAASSTQEARSPKKDNKPTRAERRAHKAALTEKTNDQLAPTATTAPSILKKVPTGPAAQTAMPPTGLAASRANASPIAPAATPSTPAPSTPSNTSSSSPSSSGSSTRHAFLKHANPSQGITEPLLLTALSNFGAVENVEIDKRKGFAHATFQSPEGLKAAIKASPVKVAEGAVVILEKREGGTGGRGQPQVHVQAQSPGMRGGGFARGRGGHGRGGRGGNRGGGSSPAASPVAPASVPASAPPAPASEPSGT